MAASEEGGKLVVTIWTIKIYETLMEKKEARMNQELMNAKVEEPREMKRRKTKRSWKRRWRRRRVRGRDDNGDGYDRISYFKYHK